MTQHVAADHPRWRESPAVTLAAPTGLNGLNYLDRYVAAATLPLILAGLGLSDAAGGFLQSAFIVAYSLACPVVGWIGDRRAGRARRPSVSWCGAPPPSPPAWRRRTPSCSWRAP